MLTLLAIAQQELEAELPTEESILTAAVAFENLPLNEDQSSAFDPLKFALDSMDASGITHLPTDIPNVHFLDGPAGSGKTHLYKKSLLMHGNKDK